MVLPEPDVHGYTIFCDDIRREDNGKLIFIGVYAGTMLIFGDFPVTLSKFVVCPTVFCKMGLPNPKLKLTVSFPGDAPGKPLVQSEFSFPEEPAPEPPSEEDDAPRPHLHRLDAPLVLSPCIVQKRGIVRVRAIHGDQVVELGSLIIDKAPQPAPTQ